MEETKRGLKKFGQADFTEENGWVTTTTRPTSGFAISPQQFTNTAVRGKFRQSLSVFVRDHPANPGGKYNVHFNAEGHGIIDRTDHAEGSPRQDTVLQRFTFPALPEHEFLLTMAGPELRVWLDGEMVSTIHDPAHPQGTPGIGISEVGTAVRDLAVAELPASFASASTPGPTEVWQPLFTDAEWQTGNAKREAKDGMQHLHDTGWRKAQPSPDGAIRARIQFREGARNPAITARHLSQENEYVFALQSDGNFVVLQHHIANQLAILGSLRLSKPLQPGDSIDLELRLQGDHLVGLVNGAVAIDVHDGSGQDAGEWGLGAADGWYESVEVQTLPTPTATAIKLADTQHLDPSAPATGSAAEPWQDILRDPPPPSLSGAVEQTPEGVRFTGPGSIWRGQRQGPHGDGAIRMRATFDGAHVTVRARASNTGTYVLSLDAGKAVRLSRWEETTHSIVISVFPLPSLIQIGQDYDLELRAVGQTLTAKFNGEVLGTVTDGTFAEGNFDVTVTDQLAAPALVKSIAVLNLNPPATADPQPPQ
jgi:hypothetical protein